MAKLDWQSTQLMVGQYWHPTVSTGCLPKTVSFALEVPFNPLSLNPQIRFTKKMGDLKVLIAALSQGYFKGKAPAGSHINAAIPEIHAQIQYESKNEEAGTGFLAGAGYG